MFSRDDIVSEIREGVSCVMGGGRDSGSIVLQ